MIMSPGVRRFVLTVHVVSSVGWLGAVLAFVGLALTASTSSDGATVRGAILVMEPLGWYVLLPLVVLSLLTGIIQGFYSQWGLIRHYWVLFKLVIGSVSTYVFVLFLLTTLGSAIDGAADPATSVEQVQALAGTPRNHALLALGGLLTASALAVYKPRGLTRYGRRRQGAARADVTAPSPAPAGARRWVKAAGFILGVVAWAALLRVVLGTDGGEGGGHAPGGGTTGNTEQPAPGGGGGHTPPPGVPGHGG